MNTRHLILAAGLIMAASLAFLGDKTPRSDLVEPVVRKQSPAIISSAMPSAVKTSTSTRPAKAEKEPVILALLPRESLFDGAESDKSAEGLFNTQTWSPPPPPPPKPAPPPPPSAPPLPFTYLGKKIEDGTWEVYLARGDQTLILHAQAVIDGTYRVDAIKPPTLSLTYLPLNQVQTLTIGGTD